LEAYDLAGTLRGAAALAGCDHKTVAHWVAVRDREGGLAVSGRRRPAVEGFAGKIGELVERSHGKIRADVAHQKLVAIGYLGSERTTRRWVAEAKRRWRRDHGRRTRPWIPEPGLWMQWDYGAGPKIDGRSTVLFCAWLAWSRYRVVVALRDKTMASVVMGLDRALRRFGGAPTYALTDNERTVSVDHVCGIAVRNPQIVEVARHYGLTIATCVPADPQSKGRQRSDGPDRESRSGLDRSQPPGGLWVVRRAGGGVRGVDGRREHPAAPFHPRAADDALGPGA
jgi:transposase